MKKWLWIIVAVVVSIAIGVGCYFIFRPKTETNEGELAKHSQVMYFDEVQHEGDSAVVRAWAVGEDFTGITYQIDNADEVTMTSKTGACSDAWDMYKEDYEDMRYIDTRNTLIDLTGVEAGDHILKIKVYNGEDSEVIYKITFEVKKATATA